MGLIKRFEDFGAPQPHNETAGVNETKAQVAEYIEKFKMKMGGSGPGAAAGWIDGIGGLSDADKKAIWDGIQGDIDYKKPDPTELPKWAQTSEDCGPDHKEEDEVEEAKVTDAAQEYVSNKIAKLKGEGYDDAQAAAIAYSMARKKGYSVGKNPNESVREMAGPEMTDAEWKYQPENSNKTYTKEDFISIAKGNVEYAKMLRQRVEWQHPETLVDEDLRDGEIKEVGDTYEIVGSESANVNEDNDGATEMANIIYDTLMNNKQHDQFNPMDVDVDSQEVSKNTITFKYHGKPYIVTVTAGTDEAETSEYPAPKYAVRPYDKEDEEKIKKVMSESKLRRFSDFLNESK